MELQAQISELSLNEKTQLYQKLGEELGWSQRGIEKMPNVQGGDACIAGTRIPVWVLENSRRFGFSEARILANYPTLHAADLVNAWAYVEANQREINEAIHANEIA